MNLKSIKVIVLVLILVAAAAYGYFTFFGGSSEQDAVVAVTESGSETIELLDRLKTLRLETALLEMRQFKSLKDETRTIVPGSVGRNNPFAPIGRDTLFVPAGGSSASLSAPASTPASTSTGTVPTAGSSSR